MIPDVLTYLKTQRVCVLGVQMPDGSPHAATVHFAHTEEPLTFFFLTNPHSRKHEAFAQGPARATLVVGSNEDDMKTLQLDGMVALSSDEKLRDLYDKKFPDAERMFNKDVLFTFIPTWWRFTDWTKPEGKTVSTSDGKIVVAEKE